MAIAHDFGCLAKKWAKNFEILGWSRAEGAVKDKFAKGNVYAAYLGLAPGERFRAEKISRLGITKTENSHQQGNSADVTTYADKANARRGILHPDGKLRHYATSTIAK